MLGTLKSCLACQRVTRTLNIGADIVGGGYHDHGICFLPYTVFCFWEFCSIPEAYGEMYFKFYMETCSTSLSQQQGTR